MSVTKPPSKHLKRDKIERVAACLSETERRTAPAVRALLEADGVRLTTRAVRYALQSLIEDGRARRIGKTGQRTWVFAVPCKQTVDTQIGI